jgi:hypothetical protein
MTSSILARAGVPILALALAVIIGILRNHARLLARLRSRHHLLWVDLGCPSLTSVLIGSRTLQATPDGRLTYRGWLSTKGYRDVNDPELEALGVQLQRLWLSAVAWVCLALLLLAVAKYFRQI